MDVREKLVELIAKAKRSMWGKNGLSCELARNMYLAENLIANGVTVQEQNGKGCPYCDIAKANEGVINTALWVKEPEINKWTMMGKREDSRSRTSRLYPTGDH